MNFLEDIPAAVPSLIDAALAAFDADRDNLNGADPTDPKASALYGDLAGLPPVRVHVGDDEVLLDDALRYVARAVDAGVDARVDVWQGMPHGFSSECITEPLEKYGECRCYIRDPDGYLIEIGQSTTLTYG